MRSPEDPRKIAFVGTSSTGKTTIIEHLASVYGKDPRVVFVPEAAREYFASHPSISVNDRFGAKPQGEIQQLAVRNEQVAMQSGVRTIICDRSALDAVAYVRGHGDKEGSRRLLEEVKPWISTYDVILLLDPTGVPYKTDDVRKESEAVRERNHKAFVEVFMEAGVEYELLSGTQEERMKRVDEILDLQLKSS